MDHLKTPYINILYNHGSRGLTAHAPLHTALMSSQLSLEPSLHTFPHLVYPTLVLRLRILVKGVIVPRILLGALLRYGSIFWPAGACRAAAVLLHPHLAPLASGNRGSCCTCAIADEPTTSRIVGRRSGCRARVRTSHMRFGTSLTRQLLTVSASGRDDAGGLTSSDTRRRAWLFLLKKHTTHTQEPHEHIFVSHL